MQYILDDLHGEGRNIRIDPQDTLMSAYERLGESEDTIVQRMHDSFPTLRDTLLTPPPEQDK